MYYAPEFEAVAGTYMALPVSERAGYVEERKKVVGRLHEVRSLSLVLLILVASLRAPSRVYTEKRERE